MLITYFVMELISLNKTVILQKEKILKAVKLIPKKMIVFEKLRFKPENAIGHPFGTSFSGKYQFNKIC